MLLPFLPLYVQQPGAFFACGAMAALLTIFVVRGDFRPGVDARPRQALAI